MIFKRTTALCLVLLMVGSTAFADATVDQLVKSKFGGKGKVLNVFGGKAAKDGLEMRTAVSGDRKATKTGKNVEVIDLAEQMIWRYSVNRKGKAKKCQATTFDEFRLFLSSGLPASGASEIRRQNIYHYRYHSEPYFQINGPASLSLMSHGYYRILPAHALHLL